MEPVRVAILGVGNCASALVQGVRYYREALGEGFVPGLMHPQLGPYPVGAIEFSAAFDIDQNKVGKDLSQAIFCPPNNTAEFAKVPWLDVPVHRGMTHDGLGQYLSRMITKAPGTTSDIAGILRDTGSHVVVNFLPVGSEMATKWYVEQVAKLRPGASGGRGDLLSRMANRDLFYVVVLTSVGMLFFAPAFLPWLTGVLAVGSQAYWLGALLHQRRTVP